MTNEAELRRLVDELEDPIRHVGQMADLLYGFTEGLGHGKKQHALFFVSELLNNAVDKMDKAHHGLDRALSSDVQGNAPTPLHSA